MSDTKILLSHLKLKFNIDHPNVEESYSYGYESALASVPEDANPFAAGTLENEQWNDGWWAGFYGEQPLFLATDNVEDLSANDYVFSDSKENIFIKFLEISGVIAISAFVGYQLFELVA
ncbi:MAG: hypothetical protein A3E88_03235 [Legionellales bacterium RIFCSPHIGHO2_12_FULL_35_11]|nr:MAG: hypothetical protein A3E88_03235 [Legionellales bacterium RIFCSPHIGHO2_12_FULL_35_11]